MLEFSRLMPGMMRAQRMGRRIFLLVDLYLAVAGKKWVFYARRYKKDPGDSRVGWYVKLIGLVNVDVDIPADARGLRLVMGSVPFPVVVAIAVIIAAFVA